MAVFAITRQKYNLALIEQTCNMFVMCLFHFGNQLLISYRSVRSLNQKWYNCYLTDLILSNTSAIFPVHITIHARSSIHVLCTCRSTGGKLDRCPFNFQIRSESKVAKKFVPKILLVPVSIRKKSLIITYYKT